MRRLKRLLPFGTFWRMEKHDIQSMRSIQEGLRAEVPPIFLLCAGPLHEDQPWFQGGLSCCMMFIVFRACRSSFSRFDLNWSSNLNKHFDSDLHVSVLDSFCMHLPSFQTSDCTWAFEQSDLISIFSSWEDRTLLQDLELADKDDLSAFLQRRS